MHSLQEEALSGGKPLELLILIGKSAMVASLRAILTSGRSGKPLTLASNFAPATRSVETIALL
jgi:hypothetical protein